MVVVAPTEVEVETGWVVVGVGTVVADPGTDVVEAVGSGAVGDAPLGGGPEM